MTVAARVAEAQAFLARHPDIRHVEVMLTDLNGVLRGKSLRSFELERVYRDGLPLPSSIAALTLDGDDAEQTGLLWEIGDMDCLAYPVSGTLSRCPWLSVPTAQVLIMLDRERGQPAAGADPRLIAAQVIERLIADGLHPVLAVELEFYLLDSARLQELPPAPAVLRGPHPHVYSIEEIESRAEFLDELHRVCEAQDLPLATTISEFGAGQFEITLHHRTDALRALDDAILYKRVLKGVAARHGLTACFMAKPFARMPGSGLHLHLSLNDARGRNVFAAEAATGSRELQQAIAGMAASAPELMAVFAPFGNSYRRYQAYNCAPVNVCWGVNNRTVPLRIPTGTADSRHVEHRICGADANPYLVAAAILAGVHHGLVNALDPGPAVAGDGYQASAAPRLPAHWLDAIERLRASPLARDYLGERFVEVYCAVKRTEASRYFGEVPKQDYDWYLRLV